VHVRVLVESAGVVKREGIPSEAVGERDKALYANEIFVRFRLERHICLIDANRKNTRTRKSWQFIGRMLVGETHHCPFISAVCTLMPASVLIILTTFDAAALAVVPISATMWWL
jgi:ABC-type methionine transport system permease subunit